MKIKEIPRVDRPREKMEKYGPNKLSDAELLAILLRTGTKNQNAVELARKILRKFPQERILKADLADFKNTFGLGTAKACEIIACIEFGKRFLRDKKSELILSPRDVWENLKDIRQSKKEHFVVFYLDARNQKINREIISIGILNASLIHPREVFEPAIQHTAAQILVAHNHPTGDIKPSDDDLAVTKRLVEAGKILGIEITDHVIVAENAYLSLKCEGLL